MEVTEKTGKLLTVYKGYKEHQGGLSIDDVVDIMYSGYEYFDPKDCAELPKDMTKQFAARVLANYEEGIQKIPSDERIAEGAGDLFSVEEIKKWALKAVCHFYRCSSADKILIQLGLLAHDVESELRATDVCELAVWEWFGEA